MPEIVAYEENGRDSKSLDYGRLTAVLVEAVKELKTTRNPTITLNTQNLRETLEFLPRISRGNCRAGPRFGPANPYECSNRRPAWAGFAPSANSLAMLRRVLTRPEP